MTETQQQSNINLENNLFYLFIYFLEGPGDDIVDIKMAFWVMDTN